MTGCSTSSFQTGKSIFGLFMSILSYAIPPLAVVSLLWGIIGIFRSSKKILSLATIVLSLPGMGILLLWWALWDMPQFLPNNLRLWIVNYYMKENGIPELPSNSTNIMCHAGPLQDHFMFLKFQISSEDKEKYVNKFGKIANKNSSVVIKEIDYCIQKFYWFNPVGDKISIGNTTIYYDWGNEMFFMIWYP